MSRKIVTLLLFCILLGMALVHGQNESAAPATGKAVSADVTTGDIQYDAQGHVISKTTIKGISIKDTGTGGTLNPNYGVVPVKSVKSSPPSPSGTTPSPSIVGDGKITQIWQTIIGIGSLQFLFGTNADDQLCGFLRIIMAILVFTLLYLGLSAIPGLTRGTAIAIGILLSIVSVIFMPCSIFLAWGTAYATLIAFVVVFGPALAGGAFLLLTPTPNRKIAFLKLIVVLILMWLVAVIGTWAGVIGGQ